MAREHSTDDTYQTGLEQQAAEHHEDGSGKAISDEMVESARAHDETEADQPAGDAHPGSSQADARKT